MKKIFWITGLLVLLVSCTKEQDIPEVVSDKETTTVVFSASLPETKVYLGEKDGDTYPTLWQAGDVISVNGYQSVALQENDGYVGTNHAEFSVTGTLQAPYYSAYPASAVSNYSSGTATVTIPTQQTYVAGQHDPAAYLMVGSGNSPSLSFNPQVALFKITPTAPAEGTLMITSIRLEAIGGEKMSGAFTTDFSSLSGGENNYVEIAAPEGGLPFGTTFTFAFPAGTYASGLRFIINASDDTSMSFSRTSSFTAAAGTLYPLTAPAYVPSAVTINAHWPITSSSITLRWNCSNPATRTKKPWKIHVYTDEQCANEVSTYDLPASDVYNYDTHNRFVVTGLSQGTTYWFKIEDVIAGALSDPVSESTPAFTVVQVPTTDITAPGVVLAEDFSEIAWGAEQLKQGCGYFPSDRSNFSNHSTTGATFTTEEKEADTHLRASSLDNAVSGSRLANWLSEQKVYIHPGYLKLGTSSSAGFVLTPAFQIESGKTALADVTLSISRYNASQDETWALCVVSNDGYKGGRESDFSWPNVNDPSLYRLVSTTKKMSDSSPWDKITVSGLRIQRGNKLAFGRVKGGNNNGARVLLSDISVEVKALSTSSLFAYPASGITSSTIPFTWNGDPSHAFTATLYSNAACTSQVASFTFAASESCWGGVQPKYVFGGLTPGTTYYLKVTDTTDNVESNVASATTEAFTIVQMPASITSTGVALAEDFGEIRWHSDMVAEAAGFVPNSTGSFSSLDVKNYVAGNSASGEVKMTTTAPLASSRLANWAYDSNVYYHCGNLKMGTSSGKGWILTPQFPVMAGKKAIVSVTVTAARFNSSQETTWALAVLNEKQAKVNGYAANFNWPDSEMGAAKYNEVTLEGTSWNTVTVSGLEVYPGDRIAFGPKPGSSSSASRIFVNDITVQVTALEDVGIYASVVKSTSSTVVVEWTEGTSKEDDKTRAYNASLYDNADCTGSPVRSFDFAANASYWSGDYPPRFVFSGLSQNTQYYIKVTDTSNNKVSEIIPVKTAEFTVVTMLSSISSTGVCFAEDFSELCWNSDYNACAVGIDPDSSSSFSNQTPLDASAPYDDVRYAIWWSLFQQDSALPNSRLAGWAWDASGSTSCIAKAKPSYGTVWVRPGYVQIGTRLADGNYYDCNIGWLLTPEFPIAEGKIAIVEVTITASPGYGANKGKWCLMALTPAEANVTGNKADFDWPNSGAEGDRLQAFTFSNNDGETWETVTKELKLQRGSRIAFGSAKNGFTRPSSYNNANTSESRRGIIHLSDIKVEVTEIIDEGEPTDINVGME